MQHLFWELYSINYPKDKFKEKYAEIILATNKDHYLLSVYFMSHPIKSRGKISRFMLDGCERLSLTDVRLDFKALNPCQFEKCGFIY